MNSTITDVYKNSFINAVVEANKELYTYINHHLNDDDLIYSNTTGFGGDNSLKIDLYAEDLFIKHLNDFGNIFSEECGYIDNNKNFDIIIDPIDGSDNFISNLPYYGTSVALKNNKEIIAGFVCNLVNGTLIYKAFEDNIKEINFSKRLLNHEKLKNNSKIGIFERAYKYPDLAKKLYDHNLKFRSPGAVALSLSNARSYDFVLFAGKIREFDIAASLYICNELFIYKTDNFLLISKNKLKFNLIKEIIKE